MKQGQKAEAESRGQKAESGSLTAVRKRRERVRDDSVLKEDGGEDVEAFAETRDVSFVEGAFFVLDPTQPWACLPATAGRQAPEDH